MNSNKQSIFYLILMLAAGAYFIFSAYAKTVPITYFEFTITNQLGTSGLLAAFLARMLIGIEAAIGLLMLFGCTGRNKWVLKSAFILTLLFSIHLIILWTRMGDEVNCGCMGVLAPMTPSWSLLKNAILLLTLFLIIRKRKTIRNENLHLLSLGLLAVFIVLPFIIFPIQEKIVFPVDTLKVATAQDGQVLNYESGRHMVSLMSLTCSHCRKAAIKMEQMKTADSSLVMQVVFYETENPEEQEIMLKGFMKETKMQSIPYRFISKEAFLSVLQATGESSVPAIYWLDQGKVERSLSISELNQKELKYWLSAKE